MKHTALAFAITTLLAGCDTSTNDSQAPTAAEQAYEYLVQLSSTAEGIGARPTGTEAETRAAAWIQDHLAGWGYDVQRQPFTYTKSGASKNSQNLIAELKGKSDKVILIGASHSTSRHCRTSTLTRSRATSAMRATYSPPSPSNNVSSSPTRRRKTRQAWRAAFSDKSMNESADSGTGL